MSDKLKSCPFCRAIPSLVKSSVGVNLYRVLCRDNDCLVLPTFVEEGKAEAIKAWNTRPREDRLVELLKEGEHLFNRALPTESIGSKESLHEMGRDCAIYFKKVNSLLKDLKG